MDISKLNTSRLLFDPLDPDTVKTLRRYPEFNIPLWEMSVSQKTVVTYIILMYDMGSELWEMYPNYWQRKRIAGVMAGFGVGGSGERKNKFSEEIERMMLGYNQVVNRMVVRYCMFFHDVDYTSMISYLELFMQETMRVMDADGEKDAKTVIANINSLNTRIKELSREFFGGDETKECLRELYKSVVDEILRIRPELISIDLREKNPPIKPVYGSK